MFGANPIQSTTLHIFKHSGGCIILWVCLYSLRTGECFTIKKNAYQEDSECSWVAEWQFWLKSAWKSTASPEIGSLAMINKQFDRAGRILKIKWLNNVQSRCGKLFETYPEGLTAVIAVYCASTKYWLRGVNTYVNEIVCYPQAQI